MGADCVYLPDRLWRAPARLAADEGAVGTVGKVVNDIAAVAEAADVEDGKGAVSRVDLPGGSVGR